MKLTIETLSTSSAVSQELIAEINGLKEREFSIIPSTSKTTQQNLQWRLKKAGVHCKTRKVTQQMKDANKSNPELQKIAVGSILLWKATPTITPATAPVKK